MDKCNICGVATGRSKLNEALDALETIEKSLSAARQRELELLAVIEKIRTVFNANENFLSELATIKDILEAEPSQALREHEAKVLEEAAGWFATNHVVMLQKGLLHSEELRRMAEERRKK